MIRTSWCMLPNWCVVSDVRITHEQCPTFRFFKYTPPPYFDICDPHWEKVQFPENIDFQLYRHAGEVLGKSYFFHGKYL